MIGTHGLNPMNLELLEERGKLTGEEIATHCNVSVDSIWPALSSLTGNNLIKHNGGHGLKGVRKTRKYFLNGEVKWLTLQNV